MSSHPHAVPTKPISDTWYEIGGLMLLVVLALLFLFFAGARLRNRTFNAAPPAGSVPGQPGQVIAH